MREKVKTMRQQKEQADNVRTLRQALLDMCEMNKPTLKSAGNPGAHLDRGISKNGVKVMDDNFVNDVDAAKFLGVSKQTLRNWRVIGKGPTYAKIGRCVRYQMPDLKDYADQRKRTMRK